ncbi:solute carrier family 46 member 3 [Silurus asotus]|uniref:Solute carrier family 46 member 3 n=1 Tax=Silurus asotus TaxID=30991 RepID=A0AAD5B6T1_SILAS|nr:solute carrier family 46 member 3 [Silurus asotus]
MNRPGSVGMKGLYLVEPVVAVYAFAIFMVYPLVQQYVYRRLWQQITNTSYPVMDTSSQCDTNHSSNLSSQYEVSLQSCKSLFLYVFVSFCICYPV